MTDLIEYETLSELIGKRIKLKFQIKGGESLPKKLCSKTFCQYDFLHQKQDASNAQKMVDGQIIEEVDEEDKSESEDDMEGIGDVEDENDTGTKAKKKKYKTFKTKEVAQKTQEPVWDYSTQHMLDIDEDIILKFQTESLAVAVYGMQDGREKFGKALKNVFGEKDQNKSISGNQSGVVSPKNADKNMLGDQEPHVCEVNKIADDELEKLRIENAKLLKMLEDKEKLTANDKVSGKDGCGVCSTTCTIF